MEELQDEYILNCIEKQTGHKYVFAVASSRKWGSSDAKVEEGTFYQLMPDKLDDGFFDWYCYKYENEQFYKSKSSCAFCFSHIYSWWVEEGKPSYKDEFS